jgi:heat shock protein 4
MRMLDADVRLVVVLVPFAQDRVIHETMQARNDLESYVLDMKSRLNGDLAPYIKEADKEAFLVKLNAEEDWLYNDGFDCQKSEYRKRINDLKTIGDAVVQRYNEHHQRETYVATLKSAIGHYSQLAASTEEKFAHITAEERKKVIDECNAVDQWLATALSAQDKLTPADPPAVTILQLQQKKTALEQVVSPIMHKPKPAPPKVEEKKPEEPKKTETPADGGAAAPEAEKPAEDTSKPMEQ